MKVKKIVVPVFAICLMASLCMNIFLYQKVVNQYGLLQSVRLDPTGARMYTEANARIPEPRSGVSRIIFFGDSRMVRWNPLPDLANGQLLNRSVPGETTAQAVLRLKTDVLELKPDIAVVQIGINDLKAIGVFPEQKEKIVKADSLVQKTAKQAIKAFKIKVAYENMQNATPEQLAQAQKDYEAAWAEWNASWRAFLTAIEPWILDQLTKKE